MVEIDFSAVMAVSLTHSALNHEDSIQWSKL